MNRIHVLSPEVCSLIAAGEVVDRPASVAKELVENAIDAGAGRIVVEVAESGRRWIRVTDDGEGMSRDDALVAFGRHATSKIVASKDLEAIGTLGFRGEALYSIAAVSKIRLTTARRGDGVGTDLLLEASRIIETREAGGPPGTRIEITDLFFNTPARKKFLKSNATELSHITRVIEQQAAIHPSLHFVLTHNGRSSLDLPAASSLRERLVQLYGTELLDRCVAVSVSDPYLSIEGWVSRPQAVEATRPMQELFVNRRSIRSPFLLHAAYDAYGTALAKGRHPIILLKLQLDPAELDVNVHPQKREVRFRDQQRVHRFVRTGLERQLKMTVGIGATGSAVGLAASEGGPPPQPYRAAGSEAVLYAREPQETLYRTPSGRSGPVVRPLGQIHNTYLLAEVEGTLQILDQHAAHERVLYEQFLSRWQKEGQETQPLLLPVVVEVSPSEQLLLDEQRGFLNRIGIEVEPFGGKQVVVRSSPPVLANANLATLLHDLIAEFKAGEGGPADTDDLFRRVAASMACHAAVRAGDPMGPIEIQRLILDLSRADQPQTCPHGRPTHHSYDREQLERLFRRR
jgi:DNA mismatch repair protein MutL